MKLSRTILRWSRQHGFGLLEMVIAILIVAVLVALLVPTLNSMRKRAQSAACLSNIKQLVTAITSYAAENDGYLPYPYQGEEDPTSSKTLNSYMIDGDPWKSAMPYLNTRDNSAAMRLFYCPTMKDPEYGAVKAKESDWKRSSYYYYAEFTSAPSGSGQPYFRRERLGTSTNGIRALVSDITRFPNKIPLFHEGKGINVGFSDGAVVHIRTDPPAEFYREIFPSFPSGNTGAATIQKLVQKFKESR